jgi:cell division protein FtsI (penicillin-binding protein 3)
MDKRVKLVLVFFILLLVALSGKAFYLQVLHADDIIAHAYRRFEHTIALSPSRGIIHDRRGQPLAISLDVKSIAANPRLLKDQSLAAARLSQVLNLDRNALRKKLKEGKYFVWIKRQGTPHEVEAVRALNLKGVGFFNEKKRFYPESDALANVLGIVGIDGTGLEGLELFYDQLFKSVPRHIEVEKDGLGRIIYAQGLKLADNENMDSNSLGLTIDKRLQYIAYASLKDAVIKNDARSGYVIITNPHNGDIYAMASYPSFDPNSNPYRHFIGHLNRAVMDVFEPGSIIKPIWIAWGLDKNILEQSQTIFCENGVYHFHHAVINDHEKYGILSVRDVVKFSSNIGMVKLFTATDAHQMYSCMRSFGLGSTTGIDYPGEPKGLIRNPERWRSIDKATISFGQGFAATGIQIITAFNALVNGGILVKPHLIDKLTDHKGITTQYRPTIVRKVISEKTSEEIVDILKAVVLKGGTAEAAYMNNYIVFGKTGTAQKLDPFTRSYSRDAYTTTFIGGIIDATGRLCMTIMVCIDEPHPYYYASIVACPIFKEIADKCVNILDMRPIITLAKEGGRG